MYVVCNLGYDSCRICSLSFFCFPPPSFPPFIVFVFYLQHAWRPAIHPKTNTQSLSGSSPHLTSTHLTAPSERPPPFHALTHSHVKTIREIVALLRTSKQLWATCHSCIHTEFASWGCHGNQGFGRELAVWWKDELMVFGCFSWSSPGLFGHTHTHTNSGSVCLDTWLENLWGSWCTIMLLGVPINEQETNHSCTLQSRNMMCTFSEMSSIMKCVRGL